MTKVVPSSLVVDVADDGQQWRRRYSLAAALSFNILLFVALFFRIDFTKPVVEPKTIPIEIIREQPKPKPEPQPEPKQKEQALPPKQQPKENSETLYSGEVTDQAPGRTRSQEVKPEITKEAPISKADDKPSPKPAEVPGWATQIQKGYDLFDVPSPRQKQDARSSALEQGASGSGNAIINGMSKRIASNVIYPPAAGGLSGVVQVEFRLSPDGKLSSLYISRSSGSALLDRALLDAVVRSAPFVGLPPQFYDRDKVFTLDGIVTPNSAR
ncbi:MAG: TonB family protein [Rhizobiales bacterium]|nr:TonB family protein [Hyphomicrobiales bacterium]